MLKNDELETIDDTKFSGTIADAIRIVEREGFRLLLTVPFMGKRPGSSESPEEYRIYWNPELAALLTMESYGTTTLNAGRVYFAWKANEWERSQRPEFVSGYHKNQVIIGYYDIREAFVHRLSRMKETGTFVKQWPEKCFLSLLHWMDRKAEDYDHEAITAERLALLPEYVRKAMAYTG